MSKLTETKIRHIKPASKDQWLSDGAGLYLRIRKGGSRGWVIRRMKHGKNQVITLGSYPETSLKQARLQAAQYQLKQDVSGTVVAELVTRYMREVVEHTHKRAELPQGYMDRAVLPAMSRRKVRDVTRAQCVNLIQDYAVNHGHNGNPAARAAEQLRSNLSKLFGYAVELGLREDNPMLGVTRRVTGYIPKPRDRVLSDEDICKVWHSDHHNAPVLRFLLLTGLRLGEAWAGSIDGGCWIVPGEFSKNGKPHWVHLTDSARKQLPLPACTMRNIQGWVERWCISQDIEKFTPHDLRRTFVTRLNELGVMPHIAEKCVNHSLEGVLAVYNHAQHEQERIEAVKRLEQHIREVCNG